MIEYKFDPRGLIAQKFNNPTELQKATELNYATCFRLMKSNDEILAVGIKTVTKLCGVLGCLPGDLFMVKPTARKKSL